MVAVVSIRVLEPVVTSLDSVVLMSTVEFFQVVGVDVEA